MQPITRETAAPSIDETTTEASREDATPAPRRLRLKTGIKAGGGDSEQAGNEHGTF